VALRIPTDPAFGSLNLASAVQVIAYEWREALGGWGEDGAGAGVAEGRAIADLPRVEAAALTPAPLADAQQIAGLLQHWEQSLIEIGFLDPQAPKKLMPRLQQLFNRAALTPEEVHILRGVARQMTRHQAEKG
jgi:tRNA/rRNA methyltransferase